MARVLCYLIVGGMALGGISFAQDSTTSDTTSNNNIGAGLNPPPPVGTDNTNQTPNNPASPGSVNQPNIEPQTPPPEMPGDLPDTQNTTGGALKNNQDCRWLNGKFKCTPVSKNNKKDREKRNVK